MLLCIFEVFQASGGPLETLGKEFWFVWPETYPHPIKIITL